MKKIDVYSDLIDRINKFPIGAPKSKVLYEILKMLFSEKEAKFLARLPTIPFRASDAAKIFEASVKSVTKQLDALASRGMLVDVILDGETMYFMPPPMAGFFEFTLMRVDPNIDQKKLAELYYQYMNIEEDFIRELSCVGDVKQVRVFPNEESLTISKLDKSAHVLPHDRVSEVIENTKHISVSKCFCRNKMKLVGKECQNHAPIDNICLSFNAIADSLARHGLARAIDKKEAYDILHKAYDHNLVQFGENVQQKINFVCNCCGCCCEGLLAHQRFAPNQRALCTGGQIPKVDLESCIGCGKCENVCPVHAIEMVAGKDKKKKAQIKEEICIGCGVCVRRCPKKCMKLVPVESRMITPVDSMQRFVAMAIERGKIQNLFFEMQALSSHRILAMILSAILKLPPAGQLLAVLQTNSKFIKFMLDRKNVRWY